ncbi:uncharacterized protein LOC122153258 [Tyto alba]|uniref:uncharacterized protein LOC122153258 n=1 Tax=Tyto alba TaxID=56313 RepID=UPI001C672B7B|nr:uncharacterized protein LOC122153258 [Tyto alba]
MQVKVLMVSSDLDVYHGGTQVSGENSNTSPPSVKTMIESASLDKDKDPELHHLMVVAVKGAFDLQISRKTPVLGAGLTVQDICSSPGDLLAPELFLNTSIAREGETVVFRCLIDWQSTVTRIVFCKNGVEVYSLKAQQGHLSYILLLNITMGSRGTYACGYQHRNERNLVRSSALSTPRNLTVTGSRSSSQAGTPTTAPHPGLLDNFPTGIVLGVAASSLLLLAAAISCAVKKVACRERCQRPPGDVGCAEDSFSDNQIYYNNTDGLGRVEVSMPNCSEASLYANL